MFMTDDLRTTLQCPHNYNAWKSWEEDRSMAGWWWWKVILRRGKSRSKGRGWKAQRAHVNWGWSSVVAGKGFMGKRMGRETRKEGSKRQRVLNTKLRNLNSPGSRESWTFPEMKTEWPVRLWWQHSGWVCRQTGHWGVSIIISANDVRPSPTHATNQACDTDTHEAIPICKRPVYFQVLPQNRPMM